MKKFEILHALGVAAVLTAAATAALPVQAQEGGPQSDAVLFAGPSNPLGVAGYLFAYETNASQFYPAFLPAPTNMPNIGILFYEDASQSVVSDQLWVQNGFWYFASDPNLVNFQTNGVSLVGALVEDGTSQDVSHFFGLPVGAMSVQSDVPEPAAGLFLGLGGALWFFLTWRRAKPR